MFDQLETVFRIHFEISDNNYFTGLRFEHSPSFTCENLPLYLFFSCT